MEEPEKRASARVQIMDEPVERLDIRFRVGAAPQKHAFPGGWLVWIFVGAAIGLGLWSSGRHFLSSRLAGQLANSERPADAYLALESLLQLDGASRREVVRGFENQNPLVAEATFRALDLQISKWRESDSPAAIDRMRELAQRLVALPSSTSADSLMLASKLATQIFIICSGRNDPALDPLMQLCKKVVQRSGNAQSGAGVDSGETVESLKIAMHELQPPPPLPPAAMRLSDAALADSTRVLTPPARRLIATFGSPGRVLGEEAIPVASVADGPTNSMANIQLVPYTTHLPAQQSASEQSRSHLSDTSFKLNDTPEKLQTAPTIARSSGDKPLIRLTISSSETLSGIEQRTNEELVKLLSSLVPRVSQRAAVVLRARGLSDDQIALASELATCSAARRLKLVQEIAVRRDLDPRDWLLWMAEVGQPEVRKLAVSLLNPMVNENVDLRLRALLNGEQDETVSNVIRQVLVAHTNRP